jgi:DNA-binding transcriptional LysR family regulator
MDRMAVMEAYVCTLEAGSFSAAARLLNVGQPAVSKMIAQLETQLGTRLLLRSSRRITATDAGHRYYDHAKRSIDEANRAEQVVHDLTGKLHGKLRVSASTTFARLHILPSLKGFLDKHPDLDIELSMDDRNVDLLEEGIDVALRIGALDDSSMTARCIAQCRRLVVGTPTYFSIAGVPKTPAELSRHEIVIFSLRGGGGNEWLFTKNGTEAVVITSGRLRVNAADGVRTAVLEHVGLAVGSAWMFDADLADGKVQTVLNDWSLPPLELWAVFPSGRMVTSKARAFVSFVEELLSCAP